MRTVRVVELSGGNRIPLVVRGRIGKMFLGLGLFIALPLISCGAYLLMESIGDPMEASGTKVLAAAFLLALGGFLILFLVWPGNRRGLARRDDTDEDDECCQGPVLTVYGKTVQSRMEASQILNTDKQLPGPM